MTTREELRLLIRRKRQAVSAIQVAEMSLRICEKVVALPEYIRARRVLCYHALPDEVQTNGLLREIQRSGRALYLPVTRPDGSMDAVHITDSSQIRVNRLGIPEPTEGEVLPPDQLDLVLAPGIAFDPAGNRLGFGKGYFDRFLQFCRCPVIGLAYGLQMVESIEAKPHDIPMDKIITEDRIYVCAQS